MQAALTLFRLYGGTGNRTTIPNLSKSRLSSFLVPFPPLPEQEEIARLLRAVDCKIQVEEARKQALDALFQTLLHHLMTGTVRVTELALPQAEGVV
jgi:type I restriction enzyme S subunit